MNIDNEIEYKLKAPYWIVIYEDRDNRKHLATIDDKEYLEFLKETFKIISVSIIEK